MLGEQQIGNDLEEFDRGLNYEVDSIPAFSGRGTEENSEEPRRISDFLAVIRNEYLPRKAHRTAATLAYSLANKLWNGGKKREKLKTAAKERNIKEGNCREVRREEMRTNKEEYETREKVIPEGEKAFPNF
jgi:hypothetical protein